MNIVILDHEPFSERRKNHFFIDQFFNIGWSVEYWCVQSVIKYSKNIKYNYEVKDAFVSYIDSENNLKKRLEKLNIHDTILFFEFSFNPDTLYIFEKVYKLGLIFTQLSYYRNPVTNFHCAQIKESQRNKQSFFDSKIYLIKNFFKDSNIRRSIILQKFHYQYFEMIQKSEFCFITGNNYTNLPQSKKYISLDYFDVIEYNKVKQENRLIEGPYIVFTDIYLGKHPDLQKNNGGGYIDQDLYWTKLKIFFDRLEQYFSMPVVIAAHPKADYTDELGDRMYFYNKTGNLVSNCEFVITHGSISTSFALLARKKVIHFFSDEFLQNRKLLNIYSNMLNVTQRIKGLCWNIDLDYNIDEINKITVDAELYQKILNKYFCKENQDVTNFELLRQTINEYFLNHE